MPDFRNWLMVLLLASAGCGPSPTGHDGATGGADARPGNDGGVDGVPGCTPTEIDEVTCNGLDDDCNGRIDDVDVGNDGICDCLRIGIVGTQGQNPSANFHAWLQMRGTTVTRFGLDATPLTLGMLQQFDVVILDQLVRDYSGSEAQLLSDWVTAGGGVMAMTGYNNQGPDWTRPNTALSVIGLRYRGDFLDGPVSTFFPHPITVGLTSVSFYGGYNVDETGAPGGTNTVVATLGGGSVGTVQERGLGHVFVWGDEWIEFDSEWDTMPDIEAFWVNILAWLGPRTSCQIVE